MLRESGELRRILETGAPMPPGMTDQLNAISQGLGMVSGLQVLTLGVTVAGFGMIAHRLNRIERAVGEILEAMRDLQDDVQWMNTVRDTERAAALASALENAAWAQAHDRLSALEQARGQIVHSQNQYRMLMDLMLTKEVAHRNAEVFAGFFRQHALAGLAKARCDWLLLGPGAASDTMSGVERNARSLRERFLDPMRTFDNPKILLSLPTAARGPLRAASGALVADGDQISGYAAEIGFCRDRGLDLRSWERIGSDVTQAPIILLSPT
ncbi:hypothetical protein TSO352_02460 [Azospirillum sp. TSO35-2]|nr:hypothetical protein TSO352_02460 [Azospirillum sp. TSO35-2]